MNENQSSASESAAIPQAQETAPQPLASQSVNAPLMENQYVQELFAILHDNGKDSKGLSALIGHVGEMESFVTRTEQQISAMKSQLAEMREVQNHPIKTALTNAIKALETKVAEVKERIGELKSAIIDGCKSAVDAFKEKGAAALNNIAKFFHIKGALKAVDNAVDKDIATCDRAVANINKFAENYHEAARGIKNMGLIIIGREPVDRRKENGAMAAGMALPYKAHKAALNGIKKAIGAMEKGLAQLDASVEAQRVRRDIERKPPERKTGIIGELEANIAMLAAQNRERAVPDKSRIKEAAL
jgi:regulator of replication initiation timing